MTITEITPDYSVAPQIEPGDVAGIAALGFRAIMCNRPDGEGRAGQTPVAEIRAEAERLGLGFAFVPVVLGRIEEENVVDFRRALSGNFPARSSPIAAPARAAREPLDAGRALRTWQKLRAVLGTLQVSRGRSPPCAAATRRRNSRRRCDAPSPG